MSPEASGRDARFSYEGLDRVLHEKARLGILTALSARREGRSFAELKELCSLTDGNLNRHLRVLEDADLVLIEKSGAGRSARTEARLSRTGRQQFRSYLQELERVLRDARSDLRGAEDGGPADLSPA